MSPETKAKLITLGIWVVFVILLVISLSLEETA